MKIYRIAWKFSVDGTYTCELCNSKLDVTQITVNPHHHFNPGQLMECQCKTSRLWANSIRYPEALKKWCDSEDVEYHTDPTLWGFCNDEYCPNCWGYFRCLETGYHKNGINYDLFGCEKCKNNKHAVTRVGGMGEAQGQQYLAEWYKAHQNMWRDKV